MKQIVITVLLVFMSLSLKAEDKIIDRAVAYFLQESQGHFGDVSQENIDAWKPLSQVVDYKYVDNNYVEFALSKNELAVEIKIDDSVYDVAVILLKDNQVPYDMLLVDFSERRYAKIKPENKKTLLDHAEKKSKVLFRSLWGDYRAISSECSIEDYEAGTVKCVVKDVDPDFRWTVGVVVTWELRIVHSEPVATPLSVDLAQH